MAILDADHPLQSSFHPIKSLLIKTRKVDLQLFLISCDLNYLHPDPTKGHRTGTSAARVLSLFACSSR